MNILTRATARIRSVTIRQLAIILLLAMLLGSVIGLILLGGKSQAAISSGGDCTENSVMECGCSAPGECVDKMQEGGRPGMQAAYTHFGLSPSEYARFEQNAIEGTAHPDGTVVTADNELVMTNAASIGRTQFGYSAHYPINGHDFYLSSHQDVLQGQSLPVWLLLNEQGEVEFAMIKACGNPIIGKKIEKEKPPREKPPEQKPPEEKPPREHPPAEKPPKEQPPKEIPPELPVTGVAGNVAGIFLSATGAGTAIHRLIARRRQ
jgi:hypothetical protein